MTSSIYPQTGRSSFGLSKAAKYTYKSTPAPSNHLMKYLEVVDIVETDILDASATKERFHSHLRDILRV